MGCRGCSAGLGVGQWARRSRLALLPPREPLRFMQGFNPRVSSSRRCHWGGDSGPVPPPHTHTALVSPSPQRSHSKPRLISSRQTSLAGFPRPPFEQQPFQAGPAAPCIIYSVQNSQRTSPRTAMFKMHIPRTLKTRCVLVYMDLCIHIWCLSPPQVVQQARGRQQAKWQSSKRCQRRLCTHWPRNCHWPRRPSLQLPPSGLEQKQQQPPP